MHAFLTLFPYVLIIAAFAVVTVFSAVFMWGKDGDIRHWLALALTATFIVCCISTLALIVAFGSGTMNFKESFLKWLGGATIAEIAGIVTIITRFFFTTGSSADAASCPAPRTNEPKV